ncbi:uncharacterized protein Triagg1_7679 [Trichoderma aggressivum f. europaeum]|uniref:BZIP domain-containing protein n=1 Tax=Trichoderma aggressivum f. europaeum TaxID=173218 RepID=A0AAE1IBI7_9HYPO|nr:hypothetical protein Triagg1_7679 [Trichoderma aggressivum f. europaeum]
MNSEQPIKYRPRGRPRKEVAHSAHDARRARGRRAQKALRERRQQHVKALEERVTGLANIIEEMNASFVAFIDNTFFGSTDVNPALLKHTTEKFLGLAQRANNLVEDKDEAHMDRQQGVDISYNTLQLSRVASSPMSILPSSSGMMDILTSLQQVSNTNPSATLPELGHQLSLDPNTSITSTTIEPELPDIRHNHLWGIPKDLSTDVTSAIPYILAGRDSFSSFLYFETMAMVGKALRGEIPIDILNSVLRYKRRYATFSQVLDVVTEVMNMLLHGTSQSPKVKSRALAEPEGSLPDRTHVKSAIAKEIASMGTPGVEYLSTWEVERYLQDEWGLIINSHSVRMSSHSSIRTRPHTASLSTHLNNLHQFTPHIVPGFANEHEKILEARILIEKLKIGAISLGEGPRWHLSFIDHAVRSFLTEMSMNR